MRAAIKDLASVETRRVEEALIDATDLVELGGAYARAWDRLCPVTRSQVQTWREWNGGDRCRLADVCKCPALRPFVIDEIRRGRKRRRVDPIEGDHP